MPTVKSSAVRSRPAVGESGNRRAAEAAGDGSGAARTRSGTPAQAISAPSAPPPNASSSASVTCERTRSPRRAPSARRTARSRRRSSARTVNRLATFAHAIRKTIADRAEQNPQRRRDLADQLSRSGFMTGRWRSMIRTYGAGPPSRCCTRRASGSSCAISAARSVPGFIRATARGPNPPGVDLRRREARSGPRTRRARRGTGTPAA